MREVNMETPEPMRSESQGDVQGVQLILHLERDHYSIGESISPRLQIMNHRSTPIEVRDFVFDWDDLAFSGAGAPHLTAPDGRDLLSPYHLTSSGDQVAISVGAEKDEW